MTTETETDDRTVDAEFAATVRDAAEVGMSDTESIEFRPAVSDRPGYIRAGGDIGAHVFSAIRDSGYVVVGVTHQDGHTNIHVEES